MADDEKMMDDALIASLQENFFVPAEALRGTPMTDQPGDAVLYLSFAHRQLRDLRKPELSLPMLCEIFPTGFWPAADRLALWDAQKLRIAALCRQYGTGNGLDTEPVRAWINDGEPAAASGMNRAEYLLWAKGRALAELDAAGDRAVTNAFTSLASDLGKYPETAGHLGLELGMREMLGGFLKTRDQMRRHIEGYH